MTRGMFSPAGFSFLLAICNLLTIDCGLAMDKHEVAAILDEIATLLELQGENPFRCNAYTKAARAIGQLESNLADVVTAGELDQIPGIGETLRDKITLLATTGRLPFYEDLKAKTPPGLSVFFTSCIACLVNRKFSNRKLE